MLTAIEAAIILVLADPNAEADVYGVKYKYKDLGTLYDIRDRLRQELSRASNRRFALSDRRADT